MQITVFSHIRDVEPQYLTNQTVIVIDVLRATSNMVTALAHGCRDILPLESIEAAIRLKAGGDLLGGERNCCKPADFDFGNSPFEYMNPLVLDKRILMTTTNGTRVIQQVNQAKHILAGAFINARACANAALELDGEIRIVCAGTNDCFSWEDGLCAGLILHELQLIMPDFQTNDFGLCMLSSYLEVKNSLLPALLQSSNGKKLCKLGFESDIGYCSMQNISDTVPIFKDGALIPFRSKIVCPS